MPSKKRTLDLNESASSNRKKIINHPGAGTIAPGAASKKATFNLAKAKGMQSSVRSP